MYEFYIFKEKPFDIFSRKLDLCQMSSDASIDLDEWSDLLACPTAETTLQSAHTTAYNQSQDDFTGAVKSINVARADRCLSPSHGERVNRVTLKCRPEKVRGVRAPLFTSLSPLLIYCHRDLRASLSIELRDQCEIFECVSMSRNNAHAKSREISNLHERKRCRTSEFIVPSYYYSQNT